MNYSNPNTQRILILKEAIEDAQVYIKSLEGGIKCLREENCRLWDIIKKVPIGGNLIDYRPACDNENIIILDDFRT